MYADIIERVEGTLKTLGIPVDDARTGDGQYNINKDKDTELLIDVWEQEERVFFQVMSPITTLNDAKRNEVLQMLLEENHSMVEAAFTLINNTIFVKETIECSAFFNQERALGSITRIAFYSEAYKSRWNYPA